MLRKDIEHVFETLLCKLRAICTSIARVTCFRVFFFGSSEGFPAVAFWCFAWSVGWSVGWHSSVLLLGWLVGFVPCLLPSCTKPWGPRLITEQVGFANVVYFGVGIGFPEAAFWCFGRLVGWYFFLYPGRRCNVLVIRTKFPIAIQCGTRFKSTHINCKPT